MSQFNIDPTTSFTRYGVARFMQSPSMMERFRQEVSSQTEKSTLNAVRLENLGLVELDSQFVGDYKFRVYEGPTFEALVGFAADFRYGLEDEAVEPGEWFWFQFCNNEDSGTFVEQAGKTEKYGDKWRLYLRADTLEDDLFYQLTENGGPYDPDTHDLDWEYINNNYVL